MRMLFAIMLLSVVMSPGISYATDDMDAQNQKLGSVSNDAGKKHRSAAQKTGVPIERRTVYGAEQIKKKAQASKGSGKRGNAELNGYINGFLDGLNSVSHSLSSTDGKVLTAKQKERRMSFKERLKLEMERKQQRNNGGK